MQRKAIARRTPGARGCSLLAMVALALPPRTAMTQPLRLRADALANAEAPAGLIVLRGSDKVHPWLDAEGVVWAGAGADASADVLVLTVRLRDARGRGELRGGRFVVATGAIRPIAIDGVSVLGRLPTSSTLEAFAGAPVVPRFGARAYDWVLGARFARHIATRATGGVSYLQRRTRGEISDEEMGVDLALQPADGFELAARSAYDLTSPGIADALASAAARSESWRVELFVTERSPGRLLPATSLFSVLGDLPSGTVGSTVRWRAAPRLDVLATGAAQSVAGERGWNGSVRATLRLDDRGEGSVGLELRRQDVSTARWTGLRAVGSQPLGRGFRLSAELELVVPDRVDGSASVWPWDLVALGWRSRSGWEVASALEASSTPEHRFQLNALARISRTFEVP